MSAGPSPRRRSRRRLLVTLTLILFGAFLVQRATRKEHGPIHRNRQFASLVWQGSFPYPPGDPIHAPYPPSYGFVMGWQCLAPVTPIRVLWACLQLGCLFLLVRLALRIWDLAHPGRAPPWTAMLLALVLVVRYLLRDMAGGGGNLVYMTLVALACIRPGEAPGEDRRPWLGVLLGLVLATKPTPLLFLGWLALRGRWRTLGVAVLSAGLLHLAPMTTLGVEGWLRAYDHWFAGVRAYAAQDDLFAIPAYDFPPFDWMNQCLRCAIARLCGTVPAAHLGELPEGLRFAGLGLAPALYANLARALSLVLVVAGFVVLFRRRRDPRPELEWTAPCLLIPVTLLVSPIAWKSHHVQLLPLFFALLALGPAGAPRRGLRVLLGGYFVLCVMPGGDLVGKLGKEGMQSLYVVTAGALALLVATMLRLWTGPADSEADRQRQGELGGVG